MAATPGTRELVGVVGASSSLLSVLTTVPPRRPFRTRRAVGAALAGSWGAERFFATPESGLPLYRAWGLADVGVWVDWASL